MDSPNDILDQGSITKTENSINYRDEISKIINIINILPKKYSNYLKLKETLNSIVLKIVEDSDVTSFMSLLFNGYKLDVLNEKRQSALHYAFFRGSRAIIGAYLSHWQRFKNDSFDWADSNGLTHLHIVCNQCHMNVIEIVKIYLKNGSDVNARYHSDPTNKNCGSTPLHFAMKKDIFDVVILLLENGADINAANTKGTTPFHIACQLALILGQDIDLHINIFHADIGAKDERGDTPLLSVFDDYNDQSFSFCIIRAKSKFDVLIKNGANILAKNNNGDTILHLLIKTLKLDRCYFCSRFIPFDDTKHAELVEEVLKSNKELLDMKNNEGKTPLQLAVLIASASIIKVLLKHKADTKALTIAGEHDGIFFCYPPLVPDFDIVQNIMNIIDLFANEEFEFSLEDHLMIIKFLVHEADVCNCSCVDFLDDCDDLSRVILFGTGIHANQVLSEMCENGLSPYEHHLLCYLLPMKETNFYMDKELEEILISCPCTERFVLSERAKKELTFLKSDIKLKNGVMLYDLMLQHPFKASRLLKDDNFDCKLIIDNFVIFKDIVLAFVTKAIVRNYVVKRAHEFFPFTPLSVLPALCFEMVLSYLSNLDIFNLCASAPLPESIII